MNDSVASFIHVVMHTGSHGQVLYCAGNQHALQHEALNSPLLKFIC